jgi:transglutaminase-like putative cysteine protease
MNPRWWLLALACAAVRAQTVDPDTDGDGLSDFHEIHKYLTDPAKKDTDGDGVPDGDWKERREYAYTLRSLLLVMRPAEVEAMNDDFQDARLVEDHGAYVGVEVIHYPLATASEKIAANPSWRAETASMRRWLEPGRTANWDDGMRRAITAGLGDVSKLDDKQLVEKATPWLLERARYEDGFTTFFTAFEGDRAFVPAELRSRVDSECRRLNRTLEEEWNRELFAKGMFENRVRGSCTSTAIYLNGCLRALGIPTRIVLTIPVIDANDATELAMVRENVSHHAVRRTILAGLGAIPKGNWTSHTFNEVWVGGRWRRLNGDRLGQPVLDERAFGLMTHVATLGDWADGTAWETIGKRQGKGDYKDVFGGPNPYSASAIDDSFGAHCTVTNSRN